MPKFTVNCSWKMHGFVEVVAENQKRAEDLAHRNAPLPLNGEYVEGSLVVDSVDEDPPEPA